MNVDIELKRYVIMYYKSVFAPKLSFVTMDGTRMEDIC